MKKRHEQFCDSLIEHTVNTGKLDDDVLHEAVKDAFLVPSERKAAIRKARLLLRKPNIRERIAEVYQVNGLDIVEAVGLHIDHIKGNITKQEVVVVGRGEDARTEVVDVKIAPNYGALKDFLTMVLPKEPKTLNVNSRNVNVNVNGEPQGPATPPPMEARILSAKVE